MTALQAATVLACLAVAQAAQLYSSSNFRNIHHDGVEKEKKKDAHKDALHNERLKAHTYKVDDSDGVGLMWEGVGAISGGGATTKLLYDYPKEQASQILDALFKPGEGLSLQILKVEIGGDTDATEGAEPSHMHGQGDENYERGYEWWLMKEAKKRNPDIKLYGLPWGWSGQTDSRATDLLKAEDPFEKINNTVDYTLKWLLGAKKHHGLHIDYVGLWNEKDAPVEYRDALRMAVLGSELGENTKVLDRLVHYPGSTNEPDAEGCKQHQLDTEVGQNWVDEEGSMFDGRSARCLSRVLNRNYISMCKTATFQWHLISSFYDYLPWPRCGVAVADTPWSGAFEITSPMWAIAHTSQFAPIGWYYAAHGKGVDMLKLGGSMVTRVSPDRDQFSMVIEKMRTEGSVCGHGENPWQEVQAETVDIKLEGKFLEAARAAGELQIWRSDMTSSSDYGVNPPDGMLFQQWDSIKVPENGELSISVHPDEVFTLTTLKTGGKKIQESPPSKPFPIPYNQNFDDEQTGHPPKMWYDQMGAWEIQESPYGDAAERGKVMRQVVPVFPNCWGYTCDTPLTYFGPNTFSGDLTVEFDIRIEKEGGVMLKPLGQNYSTVSLQAGGNWSIGGKKSEGSTHFPPDQWNHVSMRVLPSGDQVVKVNGQELVAASSGAILLRQDEAGPVEHCEEDDFPISTVGKKYTGLKPDRAYSAENCRMSCCMDENLCNVWQFNGEAENGESMCQMGRMEDGYEIDNSGKWKGATRGVSEGWHLKLKLARYQFTSIDNFRIHRTDKADLSDI